MMIHPVNRRQRVFETILADSKTNSEGEEEDVSCSFFFCFIYHCQNFNFIVFGCKAATIATSLTERRRTSLVL